MCLWAEEWTANAKQFHIDDDESTDASDGGSGEVHGDMRKKYVVIFFEVEDFQGNAEL